MVLPYYACIVEAIYRNAEEDKVKESHQRDDHGNKAEALGVRRKLLCESCQCPLMLLVSLLAYYQ